MDGLQAAFFRGRVQHFCEEEVSQKHVDKSQTELTNDINELKATNVTLENVIRRLSTGELPPTAEMIREPHIHEILAVVAHYYKISRQELCSHRRTNMVLKPRYVLYHFCRTLTGKSLPKIGAILGGRDHTTILHGLIRFEKLLASQPVLQIDVDQIRIIICNLMTIPQNTTTVELTTAVTPMAEAPVKAPEQTGASNG